MFAVTGLEFGRALFSISCSPSIEFYDEKRMKK